MGYAITKWLTYWLSVVITAICLQCFFLLHSHSKGGEKPSLFEVFDGNLLLELSTNLIYYLFTIGYSIALLSVSESKPNFSKVSLNTIVVQLMSIYQSFSRLFPRNKNLHKLTLIAFGLYFF